MLRVRKILTHFAIEKAADKERAYKLSDGEGLHVLVQSSGKKLWRFRYRFAGKENMLSFGSFPATSIAAARAKRDEARKLIEAGTDPSAQRRLDKIAAVTTAAKTFGAVAAEYLAKLPASGNAESTITKNKWLLEDLATPLARRPISEIRAAEILHLLERIEDTGRRETPALDDRLNEPYGVERQARLP